MERPRDETRSDEVGWDWTEGGKGAWVRREVGGKEEMPKRGLGVAQEVYSRRKAGDKITTDSWTLASAQIPSCIEH